MKYLMNHVASLGVGYVSHYNIQLCGFHSLHLLRLNLSKDLSMLADVYRIGIVSPTIRTLQWHPHSQIQLVHSINVRMETPMQALGFFHLLLYLSQSCLTTLWILDSPEIQVLSWWHHKLCRKKRKLPGSKNMNFTCIVNNSLQLFSKFRSINFF